jgi:hypothetical protein
VGRSSKCFELSKIFCSREMITVNSKEIHFSFTAGSFPAERTSNPLIPPYQEVGRYWMRHARKRMTLRGIRFINRRDPHIRFLCIGHFEPEGSVMLMADSGVFCNRREPGFGRRDEEAQLVTPSRIVQGDWTARRRSWL